MAKFLAKTDERNYDAVQLGESKTEGAVKIADAALDLVKKLNISGIFGMSRDEKRRRRDEAISELRSMGMDDDIHLHHSDNWAVVRHFADLAEQYGRPVTKVLNNEVKRDTADNGKTGRWIYSENSSQFQHLNEEIEQEINAERQSGSGTPSASTPTASGFGIGSMQTGLAVIGLLGAGTAGYYIYKKGSSHE